MLYKYDFVFIITVSEHELQYNSISVRFPIQLGKGIIMADQKSACAKKFCTFWPTAYGHRTAKSMAYDEPSCISQCEMMPKTPVFHHLGINSLKRNGFHQVCEDWAVISRMGSHQMALMALDVSHPARCSWLRGHHHWRPFRITNSRDDEFSPSRVLDFFFYRRLLV